MTISRDKAAGLFRRLPAKGCWLDIPSAVTTEIAAGAGFDWGLIDLEHGPTSIETATLQMIAMRGSPMRPLIRIPEGGWGWTKRALDAGAAGVMVPCVETVEEARLAVRNFYYPPLGKRGSAEGIIRAADYGRSARDYADTWRETGLLILQIETEAGVAAAAEIAAVDGVDCLFFGPSDYSWERGAPSVFGPAVEGAWARMRDAALAAGLLSGSIPFGDMTAARLAEDGCDLVAAGSDVAALRSGLDTAATGGGRII